MNEWTRKPAVAGSFYPAEPEVLREHIARYLGDVETPGRKVFGVLAPHAGYIYSGRFAADVYRQIEVPERVYILCPNHTGFGSRISVWSQGEWKTPLGSVPVDAQSAQALLLELSLLPDREAHVYEHAIEVQIPFLQVRSPNLRIIPIVLAHLTLNECESLGRALHAVLKKYPGLLVASSDMSHFLSATEAQRRDRFALDCFEEFKPDSLYKTVREKDISMCGYIPTTTVLCAARDAGCSHAEILSYGNSGESNHDYTRVVAYASGWIY